MSKMTVTRLPDHGDASKPYPYPTQMITVSCEHGTFTQRMAAPHSIYVTSWNDHNVLGGIIGEHHREFKCDCFPVLRKRFPPEIIGG